MQQPLQYFNNQQQSGNFRVNNGRQIQTPQHIDHQQHHTQTNFVPNFAQPQVRFASQHQVPAQPPQPQQVFHQQRSVSNQVGQFGQFPQQPPQFIQSTSIPVQQPQPQFVSQPITSQQPFLATQQSFPQQPFASQQSFPQQNQNFGQQQQSRFNQNQQQLTQTQQFVQNYAQPNNNFGNFQQQPQQPQQQQQPIYVDPKEEERKLKEYHEKQKLIEKHEKFVQKQYQKQQDKVRQQHQEFLLKQQKIQQHNLELQPTQSVQRQQYSNVYSRSRGLLASEVPLYENAILKWQNEHPTIPPPTTTTTTTTTTPSPTRKTSVIPLSNLQSRIQTDELTSGDLELLLQGQHQKLFSQLKAETEKSKSKIKSKTKSTKSLGRDDLLKQLKLALAESPQDLGGKNYTSMDLVLPDGHKVQVIRTTDPNLIKGGNPIEAESLISSASSSSSSKPLSFEDLTKGGILPPGANFEVLKQSGDGKIQEIEKLPPQKKVTFVYLEELDDGSYKVQGVKGNGEKEAKTSGTEVDDILKRIKNGEINLPPPTNKVTPVVRATTTTTTTTTVPTTTSTTTTTTSRPVSITIPQSRVTIIPLSTPIEERSTTTRAAFSHSTRNIFPKSISPYSTLATIPMEDTYKIESASSTHFPSSTARITTLPIRSTFDTTVLSSTFAPVTAKLVETTAAQTTFSQATASQTTASQSTASQTTSASSTTAKPEDDLTVILKSKGLHAMAKYLKQSGLDSILNETGPYTVFAPTDKAFKSLLVQLGGPERAEEKFKNNPRLLSGVCSD